MAWPNVWQSHRRFGLTFAGMALALAVGLLCSGLVTGMVAGMEDDAVEMDLGDVQM